MEKELKGSLPFYPHTEEDETDVGTPIGSSNAAPTLATDDSDQIAPHDENTSMDAASAPAAAAGTAPPPAGRPLTSEEAADGREEGEADESIVMQMEEVDEHGQSHMRNVSLEELVDSGHIMMADGGAEP